MLPLFFTLVLSTLVISIMITDMKEFIIPNILVLALLILYPVMFLSLPVMHDWKMSVVIGGGVFAIGFLLYCLKLTGGGDVKLLAVLALYTGKETIVDLLINMAIFGGLLCLSIIVLRPLVSYVMTKKGRTESEIPRILRVGERYVPYGVAIGCAFLVLLWSGRITGISI